MTEPQAVRNHGAPFWKCDACQAMRLSPINFKHKPGCALATPSKPRRCETDYCDLNGDCIACHAACGEVCRQPR
jgi:hypothetical protein